MRDISDVYGFSLDEKNHIVSELVQKLRGENIKASDNNQTLINIDWKRSVYYACLNVMVIQSHILSLSRCFLYPDMHLINIVDDNAFHRGRLVCLAFRVGLFKEINLFPRHIAAVLITASAPSLK